MMAGGVVAGGKMGSGGFVFSFLSFGEVGLVFGEDQRL